MVKYTANLQDSDRYVQPVLQKREPGDAFTAYCRMNCICYPPLTCNLHIDNLSIPPIPQICNQCPIR